MNMPLYFWFFVMRVHRPIHSSQSADVFFAFNLHKLLNNTKCWTAECSEHFATYLSIILVITKASPFVRSRIIFKLSL